MNALAQPSVIALLLAFVVAVILYSFLIPTKQSLYHPEITAQGREARALKLMASLGSELYSTLPAHLQIKGQKTDGKLGTLLRRSGNPWGMTVDEFFFFQFVTSFVGAGLGGITGLFLRQGPLHPHPLIFIALGASFGYFAPQISYRDRAKRRDLQFLKQMPDCLDLISISVAGGNTLGQAIRESVPNMPEGVLREEFKAVLQNIDTGRTLSESLELFAKRAPNDQTRTFVQALRQANDLNTPLAEILQAQSEAYREQFFAHVNAQAAQLQSRMMIFLTPTLLPALSLVILAPFVASITSTMLG